ncbi:MAG TPA: aldolase/citrate lyase family protein [Chthonomonadaceae bacterium]|nr:aldolase/citrate lyase family protein [Chthonomonadaceae bacterium]
MKSIRERVLGGDLVTGTWLNLGSNITAEIAAHAGFDWVLIDLEHGSGTEADLIGQLQAVDTTDTVPIVRIAWNEAPRFKRTLDQGPCGIMIPYVNTAAEARLAAEAMRYQPQGVRGAARFHRANRYGRDFESYFSGANDALLTVVQIETAEAVENASAIAAVEGVDVLFIGPLDLSVSLGIMGEMQHPDFRAAVRRVIDACRAHGKSPGILLPGADLIPAAVEDGFRFLAAGSDGSAVVAGMRTLSSTFSEAKKRV